MTVKKGNVPKSGGTVKSAKSKPVKPAAKKSVAAAKPAAKKSVAAAKPAAKKSVAVAKPVAKKSVAKAKAAVPSSTSSPVLKPGKQKKERDVDIAVSTEIRETRSTINTGSGAAESTTSTLREHTDIAKGIAERKAAAKAKSIARFSRPAIENNKNLKRLTTRQSTEYESMLLRLREKTNRQIAFLRGVSLTRSDQINPEEDGSDAFERQLALKLASTGGDAVFEIDEALKRIQEGTYGVCQDCDCIISPARLKVLPFARRCVACKAIAEKNRDSSERRYF